MCSSAIDVVAAGPLRPVYVAKAGSEAGDISGQRVHDLVSRLPDLSELQDDRHQRGNASGVCQTAIVYNLRPRD
jgi:hypothetical protein